VLVLRPTQHCEINPNRPLIVALKDKVRLQDVASDGCACMHIKPRRTPRVLCNMCLLIFWPYPDTASHCCCCCFSLLLLLQVASDEADPSAKSAAALLFETALLESGFDPDDPKVGLCGFVGCISWERGTVHL
jgi:hypothetical protein